MTISTPIRKSGPYDGNDAATSFAFSFKVFTAADLIVTLTSVAGVETTAVLDVDYSVTLNADQNVSPGGSVAYPLSGSPLATGQKLTITSGVETTQEVNITNGGGFYPEVIENAFDKLTIIAQQNKEKLDRAILIPVSSSSTVPDPIDVLAAEQNAVDAAAAAVAAVALVLDAKLEWKGAWSGATAYALNDAVYQGGSSYICIQAHTNQVPPNGTYWGILALQGAAGAGTGDMLAANNGSDFANKTTVLSNLGITRSVFAAAGGTVDAITGTFSPTFSALDQTALYMIECGGANTSTTPTFKVDALAAKTIVKGSNQALAVGDIPGANFLALLRYDTSLDKFQLLNPARGNVTRTILRVRSLTQGTTYTTPSDVQSFWAFVYGATGGSSKTTALGSGGVGGPGYSEKYYASPGASYSYSIGAAGANTGTAGGSTTFDVMTVTGSGGVTSTAGSTGGAGSGGDYNTTGGTGGTGRSSATAAGGGGGGAASRAGNGYNGADATSGAGGGGGGTGGAASGQTGGIAATTKNAGALTLPFGQQYERFGSGDTATSANGKPGAQGATTFDLDTFMPSVSPTAGGTSNVASAGTAGKIIIFELLK